MVLKNAIIICSVFISFVSRTYPFQDVYWKNYNGTVPVDAVSGGVDKNGVPTYVGQAYINCENLAIPVNLYVNISTAQTPNHGVHEISSSLRILCSGHKDHLGWITLNQNNVLEYFPLLVVGGYGKKCYFIGRTLAKDEVLVGKVRCTYLEAMYFASEGMEKSTTTFEVLAYSESIALRAYCSNGPKVCPR